MAYARIAWRNSKNINVLPPAYSWALNCGAVLALYGMFPLIYWPLYPMVGQNGLWIFSIGIILIAIAWGRLFLHHYRELTNRVKRRISDLGENII